MAVAVVDAMIVTMNKLAIIVPFYKREEITRLCFENLKKQTKKFNLDVYTCGSEGNTSESLACEYGFNYLEFANNPLSLKNNALIKETSKGEYDGVIILGSDNFVTNALLNYYLKLDIEQGKVYGFDDLFFYDVNKRKVFTEGDYKHNAMTVGAGRLYTREYLESVNYVVWNGKKDRGLDTLASSQIKDNEIKLEAKGKIKILDVKHEFNITNPAITRTCKEVGLDALKDFGVIHKNILSLEPTKESRVVKQVKRKGVLIEFLVDTIYFKKGASKTLKPAIARRLISTGKAKKI